MEPSVVVAREQLARMRGMNARYHDRFFSDIRFTILVTLGLFAAGFSIDQRLLLAIPVVALLGACQTAFDASYLIFARQYSARLEMYINAALGEDILVAHRMEDTYLFPLDRTKAVTLAFGRLGFSWFGFMTALYTALGAGVYVTGLMVSLPVIRTSLSFEAGIAYLIALASLTAMAAVVGFWWFVAGEGERRLRSVLDQALPVG